MLVFILALLLICVILVLAPSRVIAFQRRANPLFAIGKYPDKDQISLSRVQPQALQRLQNLFSATNGKWLGWGKDVTDERPHYDTLDVVGAWEVGRWRGGRVVYDSEKQEREWLQCSTLTDKSSLTPIQVRTKHPSVNIVPVDEDVNEAYLLHGSNEAVVQDLLFRGFEEGFSTSGAFGNGVYFADDAGKSDQYVKQSPGAEMRRMLGFSPDDDIYFMLGCKVLLGCAARVNTSTFKNADLFIDDGRRVMRSPYSSVVIDNSGCWRYREFMLPEGQDAIVTHVIAYRRTASAPPQRRVRCEAWADPLALTAPSQDPRSPSTR
jgi:hypothetical protein